MTLLMILLQFSTSLLPYKKCITEKRTLIETLLIGSMSSSTGFLIVTLMYTYYSLYYVSSHC